MNTEESTKKQENLNLYSDKADYLALPEDCKSKEIKSNFLFPCELMHGEVAKFSNLYRAELVAKKLESK